jgi:predicted ATPase
VLDNCEHLVEACARLAEALLRGCPELQVLATSREPLQVTGEVVWRVPSMMLPDRKRSAFPEELSHVESVRLFVDRATAVRQGFKLTEGNAADVAHICRCLDGIPLAIELAAARVESLPPGEIGQRLGESFGLLRQQRRTAETRQETLEAALDWSYGLLDAEEARLLRQLAVFAGTFGLDAAEQLCDDGQRAGPVLRHRARPALRRSHLRPVRGGPEGLRLPRLRDVLEPYGGRVSHTGGPRTAAPAKHH